MTTHGVCLDALNPAASPPAADLKPFGCVRMVAFDDPIFYAAVHDYQMHDLDMIAVLAWETFGGSMEPAVWGATCDRLARNARPELWVVGNECDNLAPSDSSWTLPPATYAQLWRECVDAIRVRQPDARFCLAGQVAGLPWRTSIYVREISNLGRRVEMVDVHPYAKDAQEAEHLLFLYRTLLPSLQLCVLEWNREAWEIPEYVRMLERVGVEYAAYFAWHEVDVVGLHEVDGSPNERYENYVQALAGPPEPTEVADMPEFVLGFKQYAKDHPEVGKPVENEHPFGGSYNVQMTENGLLVYSVEANQIAFLPKA